MGYSRFAPIQTPGLVLTGVQRATLVRRAYSVVLACIAVTIAGTGYAISNQTLMAAALEHPFILMFATFIPLWAAGTARRIGTPQRLGLILLFSLALGVLISPRIFQLERLQPGIVTQAGMLTGSAFAVLTAYAWLSRRDFSAWGSFFIVGVWVLLATSILNLFFQNQSAMLWLAGGTVMVFSGLLVYDTWRLKNAYAPEQYMMAAVQIYLDLLNMFMAILTLLGGRRSN